MRPFVLKLSLALSIPGILSAQTQTRDYLADNTVLIIRHAEKPEVGNALTPAGEARARAYISYFEPFHEEGWNVRADSLFAGTDSESSIRPRLTLEPISKATGLSLNTSVGTKEPEKLVALLRTQPHGSHPLIAWRHGQIPALLHAFGASPTLLPEGKWPDGTFDWVIVLQFDRNGALQKQELIQEHLAVR